VWWLTQAKVLWMYLKLAVWPWPLVIHYELPYNRSWSAAWPWLALTAALVGTTLLLLWRRHAAGFVFAAALAILSPTLLVPIPSEVAAERRMYLPLAGLTALAVAGGYAVLRRLKQSRPVDAGIQRAGPALAFSVAVTVLSLAAGFVSARRLAAYENVATLWRDALVHQPDNFTANYNLGCCLIESDQAAEAVGYLEHALRLRPQNWKAHNRLGIALNEVGRGSEAIEHLERAIELSPDSLEAHLSLGNVLAKQGRLDDAIPHFKLASQLDLADYRSHYAWGMALMDAGQVAPAIDEYRRAVERAPDNAIPRNDLGVALVKAGRSQEAMEQFREAVRLQPDYIDARNNLGQALVLAGDFKQAVPHFRRIIQLNPDDFEIYAKLTEALLRDGSPSEAIAVARQAADLARSRGQTAAVAQIEAWIEQLRAQSESSPNSTTP
jgi:Flp pilus assembly protein TadD